MGPPDGANRLTQLGALFESKNRALRAEASAAVARLTLARPGVLDTLLKYLASPSWEARCSAADALGGLLGKVEILASDAIEEPQAQSNFLALRLLNLNEVVERYAVLGAAAESTIDDGKASKPGVTVLVQQRQLVDAHLQLQSSTTGLTSSDYVSDADLVAGMSALNDDSPRPSEQLDGAAPVVDNETTGRTSDPSPAAVGDSDDEDRFCYRLARAAARRLFAELVHRLASPIWQTRHGAALGLQRLIVWASQAADDPGQNNPFGLARLEALVIRAIQVLTLDRFHDFASGRSAVAPVREAIAQVLALLVNANFSALLSNDVLDKLQELLRMKDTKFWTCRQSALLVAKYTLAVTADVQRLDRLFTGWLLAHLHDPVDEVVCSAVVSLVAVLKNDRAPPEKLTGFIANAMTHVWRLVDRHSGVTDQRILQTADALLCDLLNVIEPWLRRDENHILQGHEFLKVIQLASAQFGSRTQRVCSVVAQTLANLKRTSGLRIRLFEKEALQALRKIIQVLAISPPDAPLQLLESLVVVAHALMDVFFPQERLKSMLLRAEVGFWSSLLLVDHKTASIPAQIMVSLRGEPSVADAASEPNSGVSEEPSVKYTLCGDELQAVPEAQRDDVVVTRKCILAKVLAPLLMRMRAATGDDSEARDSFEQLVEGWLKSTSLFVNVGAALVVNEWAAAYRRETPTLPPPTLLVAAVKNVVWEGAARDYDELSTASTVLTAETNEFVEFCRAKCGGKLELDDTLGDQMAKRAFEVASTKNLSQKVREALESRYQRLTVSIETTKTALSLNTTRVMSLLASGLLYFGCMADKITKQIRPLVEWQPVETNEAIAAELARLSLPLIVAYTSNRETKPYAKVIARVVDQFAERVQAPLAAAAKKVAAGEEEESENGGGGGDEILALRLSAAGDGDETETIATSARNARLCLAVCAAAFEPTTNPLAELNALFDLAAARRHSNSATSFQTSLALIVDLAPQSALLVDRSTLAAELLAGLADAQPLTRHWSARALASLAASGLLAQMLNDAWRTLSARLRNLDDDHARRGAIEALLLLSTLGTRLLGAVALLTPSALRLCADRLSDVRATAAAAFRNLVQLAAVEDVDDERQKLSGLDEELVQDWKRGGDLLAVLAAPSRLKMIERVPNLNELVELRDYQREGITWLRHLHAHGLSGVLADDMGLGKTLQALSLVALLMSETAAADESPTLVVCPRTLVDHWCAEWARYFPTLDRAGKALPDVATSTWTKAPLVVTSYEDARARKVPALWSRSWKLVIADEGHVLRTGAKAALHQAMCSLRAQTRLLLSGTPVHNSPADLWSLFAWLQPGYFPAEKTFRKAFVRPLIVGRSPKATDAQLETCERALTKLHRLALPFVLRRLKSTVLAELPPKIVQDVECQLSAAQRTLYTAIVGRLGKATPADLPPLPPLQALHWLRQLVDHPELVLDAMDKEGGFKGALAHYRKEASAQRSSQETTTLSGKMLALRQVLTECGIVRAQRAEDAPSTSEGGGDSTDELFSGLDELPHRALIFCQWRTSARLVSRLLSSGEFAAAGSSGGQGPIAHIVLDGDVAPNERQSLVDRFNRDVSIPVMVLTTKIGGVGLNLSGADVVVMLDHDWNPVNDLQAIDRAHRLGQKRRVHVYRLISVGTVEQRVMSLQKFKKHTADVLIGSDNTSLASMAADELVDALALDGGDQKTTATDEEDVAQPAAKRTKRKETAADQRDAKSQLAELWEASAQYDEAHDLGAFAAQLTTTRK